MKLCIVNRNKSYTTQFGNYGGVFEIAVGNTITENYNEELDSATCILSQLGSQLEIEPYDRVLLIDGNTIYKYMMVDTYTQTLVNPAENKYRYEISLFSETKALEGVILPNRTITKVWGQTRSVWYYLNQYLNLYGIKYRKNNLTYAPRWHFANRVQSKFSMTCPEMQWNKPTLREVLNDLMMVADCIPVMRNNEIDYIDLTARGTDILDEILVDSPSTPYTRDMRRTLDENGTYTTTITVVELLEHEKLIDYSLTCSGATVTINSLNVYTASLSFTLTGTPNANVTARFSYKKQYYLNPAQDNINYVTKSRSSEDYVSELKIEMENTLQDSSDNLYNTTKCCEIVGARNQDDFIVTTENIKVYTQNPIYKVNHLWLCFATDGTLTATQKLMRIDLCNLKTNSTNVISSLVVEDKEFAIKDTTYYNPTEDLVFYDEGGFVVRGWKWETLAQYKNYCLSYTRGGNVIGGFETKTKATWISNFELIEIIYAQMIKDIYKSSSSISLLGDKIRDVFFMVEYETTSNTLIQAGRYLPTRNNRVVTDNQTSSLVNANRQGMLEYMKANRLGNEMVLINARYSSLSQIGNIGDTYNDSVIFKREIAINPNYISVNYYATENYVLRNYYTGVKAKIRSWKIADGNEALLRHELLKVYYEFSYTQFTDSYLPTNCPSSLYLLTPVLNHYEDEIITTGLIKTTDANNVNYPANANELYCVDTTSRLTGNSIVFTLGFLDNCSAGIYVNSTNVAGGNYGETNYYYNDDNGECKDATVIYTVNTDPYDNDFSISKPFVHNDAQLNTEYVETGTNNDTTVTDNIKAKTRQKPKVKTSSINTDLYNFAIPFNNLYKDNKETLRLSFQMELCSDTPDIIIGSQFMKDQNFISTNYRGGYNLTSYGNLASNVNEESALKYNPALFNGRYLLVNGSMYYSDGTQWSDVTASTLNKKFNYADQIYVYIEFAQTNTGTLFPMNYPYRYYPRSDIKFYSSNTAGKVYDRDFLPSDKVNVTNISNLSTTTQYYRYTYNGTWQSGMWIYVTDSNDKVLIAFKTTSAETTLYLNRLINRDKNVYDANGVIID